MSNCAPSIASIAGTVFLGSLMLMAVSLAVLFVVATTTLVIDAVKGKFWQ
jgi:hypothetical protein